MAASLDPDSWVRLPVPLANLPITAEPEVESFTPANTLSLSDFADDVDDATLFKLLPRSDGDELITDRDFLPPIAPFSLIEPASHRTVTRLKAIVFPYALTVVEGVEASITSNATASTAIYPVSVAYAGSRAQVETTVTDVAPPPPAALLLESGSVAPALGAAKVTSANADAEDWVFLLDGRYVDPVSGPDPESDDWDYSEKQTFLTSGYLTINSTQHQMGAVMSASYIGFPDSATLNWDPTPSSPAFDKLVLIGGDLMSRVIAVQKGSNYVKVRNEIGDWSGTWVDGDGLAPLIVWEATFFEPLDDGTQYIEVRVGDFDQALLELIIEWEYAFSRDVYLSAADGTLLATAPLAPNTSYVFVGNAAGSQWAVQTGAHINNLTGFYAKPIVPITRTAITADSGTSVTASTLTFLGEKPTSFFAVETYTGTGSTLTRTTAGLYPLMVWTKHNGVDFWYGAPAFNAGGSNGVTGTDPDGGTPELPKGRKIGYAYDTAPAALQTGGYLSFSLGGYQLGSAVNTSTSSNQALGWAFGAYGPPKTNKDGLAVGGRESIVSRGPLGISFFSFTGVPTIDFPAGGMAVGHGLADEDGNPLTPEIVFINQYYYNFYFRSPIGVAGRVLPSVTYGTTTYDTHLQLGKRDGFGNTATAAAAAMSGTTAYLESGKLADNKVVWVGSAMNSANAMAMGMAFTNVPGSCMVKTFTSQGAVNTVEVGFQPQLVILKCTSASSNWVVFSEQSYMSGKSLNLHTIENPITTNGSASFTSYGLTWTRSSSDAGATWLVIAVAGRARGQRRYALRAEAGAASFTGRNAALLKYQGPVQLRMTAAAGTFAFGQTTAGLLWLRMLSLLAAAGDVVTTGQVAAMTLLRAYALLAEAQPFTTQGMPASMALVTSLRAQAGSVLLYQEDCELYSSRRVAAQTGSVAVSGDAVELTHLRSCRFNAEAGAVALQGQPASLATVIAFQAGSGAFASGESNAGLVVSRQLTGASDTAQVGGQLAGMQVARLPLTADAGSIACDGHTVSGIRAAVLSVGAEAYAVSGQHAQTTTNRRMSAAAGAVAVAGAEGAFALEAAPTFYASWSEQTYGFEEIVFPDGWAN